MTDGARAFVPGHVTGLFSIHRDDDPARAGSRGAGLTLTDGVTVSVRSADESAVFLNGERADVAAVAGVLDALGVTARVEAETPLPVGAGFGVSGATALGAAYAANATFGCGRSENGLVRLAHAAEVDAGTGLGDVVAQARGGAPIREEPGAPPHGRLDGVPETARVEYASFGGLSTADVLSGDTETLSAAGERALDRLRDEPTLDRFVAASRTFAAEAGLLTDDIDEVVGDVLDAGGRASMAMLGRTVFALGHGLTDAGYDAEACRIHPAGATLQ
ncbi:pantoate kinase [Salarchaeum sp. JOR-1]|uniref:pantoate kinase n=1 Tax=Salarchaeum sp. JOR-1 TaxID=2599399 RepID=UPI0011985EA7|nr:pantoate kinase [Salarchaeum sp. JOR-1]QDX39807.1 sugar kinase [Salarchaeum sp. JOR-1]